MKTLTVRLPESLVGQIEMEARRRNVKKSDIVRERLQSPPQLLEVQRGTDPTLEEILQESWNAALPIPARGFVSPKKQKLAELIRAKKLHY